MYKYFVKIIPSCEKMFNHIESRENMNILKKIRMI